jgi:hypothetical protein
MALDASGQSSASATANATVGGPYNVSATGTGITATANFSLTNTKANQTITFGGLSNKTFGDADFGVSANATSTLAVSFTASGNCTLIGGATVHLTGPALARSLRSRRETRTTIQLPTCRRVSRLPKRIRRSRLEL